MPTKVDEWFEKQDAKKADNTEVDGTEIDIDGTFADEDVSDGVKDVEEKPASTSEDDSEVADVKVPERKEASPAKGTTKDKSAKDGKLTDKDSKVSRPEFDESILRYAGLTAEQAKEQFGDSKSLENAIRLMDQRSVSIAQANQPFYQNQGHGVQSDASQRDTKSSDTKSSEFVLPKPKDGEDWDEDTKSLVTHLSEHYKTQFDQQNKALAEQGRILEAFAFQQQQNLQQAYVNDFDGFVNKLGDEWTGLLGKGSGFELPPGSFQIQNRGHLDQVASQLTAGRQAQGLPALNRHELLDRALKIAFPEHQKANVRQEVEREVEKRNQMKTSRPSSRKQTSEDRESKAASRVSEWFKEKGFFDEDDDFDYSSF